MSLARRSGRPRRRRPIVALLAAALLLAPVAACTGSEDAGPDGTEGTEGTAPQVTFPVRSLAQLDAMLLDRVVEGTLEGATFLVGWDEGRRHEHHIGAMLPVSALPLAETGMWLAAAVLMSLVEDGTLALDEPVAAHLEELAGTDVGSTTLRQLLSHTAGLPAEVDCPTAADCDAAIAALSLDDPPGTAFAVSPAGYHVAARVAEAATGRPWSELATERLFDPLAMASTSFREPPPGEPGKPTEPADPATPAAPTTTEPADPASGLGGPIAAGLLAADGTTTADDLARFLQMFLAWGAGPTGPVLERSSIEEMERDPAPTLDTSDDPWVAATGVPTYGLGVWRDRLRGDASGLATSVSAPNHLGVHALVDRARGTWAVLGLVDVREDLEAVEASSRFAQLLPAALQGETTGGTATTTTP